MYQQLAINDIKIESDLTKRPFKKLFALHLFPIKHDRGKHVCERIKKSSKQSSMFFRSKLNYDT